MNGWIDDNKYNTIAFISYCDHIYCTYSSLSRIYPYYNPVFLYSDYSLAILIVVVILI